jgi:Holliday junction resolvase RusA-like endonuclease
MGRGDGGMNVRLVLPWPTTSNHKLVPVRRGNKTRLIKSSGAREYMALAARTIMAMSPRPKMPIGRYRVSLYLSPPWNTRRAWDIANREKSLIDAIAQAQVIQDDSMIDELLIYRDKYVEGGQVLVVISLTERNEP